jgi:hypothetical protein
MSNEALVSAVKKIVAFAKEKKLDEAYAGYKDLFSDPAFTKYKPEDQRQALRLMVLAKGQPAKPTPLMLEAYRAALVPLSELVSAHEEPGDYEMLGVCHVVIGNEESASRIFKAALAIERQRNPQSDLCGRLMTRVSQL